jgi:Secretion system C-terminal sorting domain/PKD-like domain
MADITASQGGDSRFSAALPVTQTLVVNGIDPVIYSSISSGSMVSVCSGSPQLTANSGRIGTYTYIWSTGDQGQSISVSTPGVYSVTVQGAVSGCVGTSTTTVVDIFPNPIPTISGPNAISTSGFSTYTTETGKSSYYWSTSSGGQPYAAPITIIEWQDTSPPTFITTIVPGPPAPNDIYTYPVSWLATGTPQTVSVTYKDTNGCAGTTTMDIKYSQSIDFGPLPVMSCGDGSFVLGASSSSGLPVTYVSSNPSVASVLGSVVTINGIGTTDITASQAGNSVYSAAFSMTQSLVVNPVNAIISASSSTTFCQGGSVVLTASVGSSYLWSTGATSQAITVSTSGNYLVTVTNAGGCSKTSTATAVTVNPLPTATISAFSATTFCQGGSVTLTASAGSSYLWSTGATSQAITLSASGYYSVTVTGLNGCSATSSATTVTVNPLPTPTISTSGTACANSNGVPYSVTNTAGSSYAWAITKGTQASGTNTNNITVNWGAAGAGNVSVVETNSNGCTGTAVRAVAINANPTTSIISGTAPVCANTNGVSYSVTNTASSSYAWAITGGTQASGGTANSIKVNWGAAVTGNISVVETNAAGCTGSAINKSVTKNSKPSTSTITGNGTVCTNTNGVSYSVTSTTGSSYTWTITGGTKATGGTTNSITVNWGGARTGNVKVVESNSSNCVGIAVNKAITIRSLIGSISQSACANGSVKLTAGAGTNHVWALLPGGIIGSGVTKTVLQPGNYSVSYNDTFGCPVSATKNVTCTCCAARKAANEPVNDDSPNVTELSVFPNPAVGQFTVALPERVKEDTPLAFYDMMGKQLISSAIPKGQWKVSVSLENISEGMYLVKIGYGDYGAVKKVIVKR